MGYSHDINDIYRDVTTLPQFGHRVGEREPHCFIIYHIALHRHKYTFRLGLTVGSTYFKWSQFLSYSSSSFVICPGIVLADLYIIIYALSFLTRTIIYIMTYHFNCSLDPHDSTVLVTGIVPTYLSTQTRAYKLHGRHKKPVEKGDERYYVGPNCLVLPNGRRARTRFTVRSGEDGVPGVVRLRR